MADWSGVPFRQVPSQTVIFRVAGRVAGHGANPILRWCMANLVVKADHDGGLKPDKRRSHEMIDAVVGLAMALDGLIRQPLHTGSVYDTRGVLLV